MNVESAGMSSWPSSWCCPTGQGYLVKSNLPTLSAAKTYQLWGVIKGRAISLGLLGQAPHAVAFTSGRIAPTLQARHHGGARRGFRGADGRHAGSGNGLTTVC